MDSRSSTCVVVLDKCDKNDKFSKISCLICGSDVSNLPVKDAVMTQEQINLLCQLLKKNSKSKSILVFQQASTKLICTRCSSSLKEIDKIQSKMDKMTQKLNKAVNFIELKMDHHHYGNGNGNDVENDDENGMDNNDTVILGANTGQSAGQLEMEVEDVPIIQVSRKRQQNQNDDKSSSSSNSEDDSDDDETEESYKNCSSSSDNSDADDSEIEAVGTSMRDDDKTEDNNDEKSSTTSSSSSGSDDDDDDSEIEIIHVPPKTFEVIKIDENEMSDTDADKMDDDEPSSSTSNQNVLSTVCGTLGRPVLFCTERMNDTLNKGNQSINQTTAKPKQKPKKKRKRKEFPCKICNVITISKKKLRRHHIADHYSLICKICSNVFVNSRELLRHKDKKHGEISSAKSYQIFCPTCGMAFLSLITLHSHIKYAHNED